jgi:segregation and condensation protein B
VTNLEEAVRNLIAVLLIAGEGAERRAVQRALELSSADLARAIEVARAAKLPGLIIQEHGDLLRLATHPDAAVAVRRFTSTPGGLRLSAAALETLAIVAYSQPVTRGDVQAARGVNSDAAIATLQQHGLVTEVGRADGPGRPALFATTAECLALLGIGSLRELPPLSAQDQTAGGTTPRLL